MKKIGFIDYYLDEWHANNYPAWIRKNCAAAGRDIDVSYAWAETDSQDGQNTADWCAANGVERLASIEDLVERSDYIIVLSPDNPEHHERLSRIPLMSGKPVYIDKTFSPDLSSGTRMFELAEKHGTPIFSSSALRFAQELAGYQDGRINRDTLEFVATTGPGSYKNYSVHQFEMIVCLLGTGARRIKSLSTENLKLLAMEYDGGRMASFMQQEQVPFQLSLQLNNGDGKFIGECTDMFENMIDSMLKFFETGNTPVSKEETLEVMSLIEAGQRAIEKYDEWIKVGS